ncbi:cytochrome c peroxidase [Limibacter armeniacum]|uniref:cytochrome-c peroxidase n=1 Tax=Limibacter armeniacum TaxID=466084 RepID=UPI002FE5DD80
MNTRFTVLTRQLPFILSILLIYGCKDTPSPISEPSNKPLSLELPPQFGNGYVLPENNPLTVKGVELGRKLFYDKRLSGDNTQSCASCHQQQFGFASNMVADKGITGETTGMNTMALSNLIWQKKFFWNGRVNTLEQQALAPIENPLEMHQDLDELVEELEADEVYVKLFELAFDSAGITAIRIAEALSQFERTLISADSKYDRYLEGTYEPTDMELKGMELFFTHPIPDQGLRGGNCGDCHLGPLVDGDQLGFQGFHNNGLDSDENLKDGLAAVTEKATDKGKFKAPSLRNIALTAPYMHDGRFNTLEEVVEHYDEHIIKSETLDPLILEASNEKLFPDDPIKLYLTDEEKQAIVAFLHMLTDDTFVTNPDFADPNQ